MVCSWKSIGFTTMICWAIWSNFSAETWLSRLAEKVLSQSTKRVLRFCMAQFAAHWIARVVLPVSGSP